MPASTVQTLIDISVPITPVMPTFPSDPGVAFEPAMQIACGQPANVTHLHIGSQTGTHYDTPHHILNNGVTVEQLDLSACYGSAQVIAIPETVQAIDHALLTTYDLAGCERLLLKTRNSAYWHTHPQVFQPNYAALTGDAAAYLVEQGIRLVGIDYLSIELYGAPSLDAHTTLLENNILILEGLDLSAVEPGRYTLSAFPVNYHGLDGAPTRAVLIR